MTAPREDYFRIITIGMQTKEKAYIDKIASSSGGSVMHTDNEIGLLKLAHNTNFDVCFIGQSDNTPELSYIIWLLKGLIKQSKMIVLFSSLSKEEEEKILRHDVSRVFKRPANPGGISKTIESILSHDHESVSIWETITNRLFFRKHAA